MSRTRMRTRWLTPHRSPRWWRSWPSAVARRAPRSVRGTHPGRPTRRPTARRGHAATQVVRYRDVEFTVPADWPIHDLEADPSTCVRFDVHAVYLGHPGADMRCPASVNGHAASVLVEPLDGATTLAPADVSANEVNGLAVEIDPTATVEAQVRAELPTAGLAVTVTFEDSPDAAQEILQSFRKITP